MGLIRRSGRLKIPEECSSLQMEVFGEGTTHIQFHLVFLICIQHFDIREQVGPYTFPFQRSCRRSDVFSWQSPLMEGCNSWTHRHELRRCCKCRWRAGSVEDGICSNYLKVGKRQFSHLLKGWHRPIGC